MIQLRPYAFATVASYDEAATAMANGLLAFPALWVAAEEFKRQMDARADDMQGKINSLERNIATRLDANIDLLERMLTPGKNIGG